MNAQKDIKIICCDIDGTLVRDDKSLSKENCLWISRAVREKGIKFVICSGRMFSAVSHFYKEIGVTGISSCLNGTYLVDENGNVLSSHTIPVEIAHNIVEVQKKYKIEMLCICQNDWYTLSRDSLIYKKKRPIYLTECIVASEDEIGSMSNINKFLFLSEDKTLIDKMQLEIKDHVSFYPGSNFLEIMPGGLDKGTAVDDLVAYYGLSYSNVMALGDDINDVQMLQKAGLGIAMGNALDCAKEAADFITDTNENDGVAKAIKKYVFGL